MEQDKRTFLAKVNQTETCWIWEGCKNKNGYGLTQTNYAKKLKTQYCHRVSYFLFKGEFDKQLDVLHNCDNPSCVNPEHLHLGTQTDNNKERDNRGRHKALKGADNGNSKFTKEEVDEIKKYRETGMYYKDIAILFNCNRRTIEKLCLGKTYPQ